MTVLADLLPQNRWVAQHRPWPRAAVAPEGWSAAITRLAAGEWTLVCLAYNLKRLHTLMIG